MTALELATHYFALSNDGDLDTIRTLFLDTSTYSSGQGLFFGSDDIMAMMNGFYASHQSLAWTIDHGCQLTPHIAEIEFSFLGINSEGEEIRRRGMERVVTHSGKIQHIEVTPLS
jgi:hypothetical protein